jgi:dUTPase
VFFVLFFQKKKKKETKRKENRAKILFLLINQSFNQNTQFTKGEKIREVIFERFLAVTTYSTPKLTSPKSMSAFQT